MHSIASFVAYLLASQIEKKKIYLKVRVRMDEIWVYRVLTIEIEFREKK